MKFSLLAMFCLLTFHPNIFAQQHIIDSLRQDLHRMQDEKKSAGISDTTMRDTFIIYTLTRLAILHSRSNVDSGLYYANQVVALAKKIDFKMGLGDAYGILGSISKIEGNYSAAIDYQLKAIQMRTALKDSFGLAASNANLGEVYRLKANYPEALKYFLISLRIDEAIKNEKGIAYAYNYLGGVYQSLKDNARALENFQAALAINQKLSLDRGIAGGFNNIGLVYFDSGKYAEALDNYQASLKIKEKTGDKFGMANSYFNIAEVYKKQGKHAEAMKTLKEVLKLQQEIDDQEGIAETYISMSGSLIETKKLTDASTLLTKAISISKEIGNLEVVQNGYETFAHVDSMNGNYKQALEHYKLFVATRDSITNQANTKKLVETQMQYDFDKKETLAKAEQDKKDLVAQKQLQRQKLVRNGFMSGFAVVLLFAGIFLTQRNKIKQGKKLSDELLLNILPSEVAEELKAKGSAEARLIDMVTVLFTDIIGFTEIASTMGPGELVNEINSCFSAFDRIIQEHGIEKIKTIGDSYMAAGGLPTPNTTHAVDVVKAGLAMQQFMKEHKELKIAAGQTFFEIRLGIHTGPVVAGIVGVKKFQYDIWGDTVNTASRIESAGQAGMVNISNTTYAYAKDKFSCTPRGHINVKGKGEVEMYFVEEAI
ncbi:MAG: adenylate/guanylate cyclase domain-containing protein [Saprospiraceae bacterium]